MTDRVRPRLSVVVACTRSEQERSPAQWLSALERSCEGLDAELLLVGVWETPNRFAKTAGRGAPTVEEVAAPAGSLVPVRWGLGLDRARADVVAFTTDLCTVHASWARAALDAVTSGAAAVGGPLHPAATLTRTDRAVYHLRFGSLPGQASETSTVHDVAADNAAYDRRILMKLGISFARGFWEVEANRRLRGAGMALVFRGDMAAEYHGGEALWPLAMQRFAHGRHAGAWRVSAGKRRRWQVALAAPVVPLVLLDRARRRRASGGHLPPLAGAAPAFLVLAAAWAAGEAVGALNPQPHAAANG